MRRFHQLIACYLALCLIFAGAVGISPDLHRLIEHGGSGPAHTHIADVVQRDGRSVHTHDTPSHSHGHELLFIPKSEPKRLFTHEHEFDLPRIPLQRICHLLTHLLEGAFAEAPGSSENGRTHHHDSLSQLIVSGLLDQHVEFPLVPPISFFLPPYRLSGESLLLVKRCDPQTAPRGPPFVRDQLA